jgi:DNA polymerase-1
LLQDGTVTGRFASQNPNLQNIPVRSEHGKVIRKAFIAAPGYSLVACDYSQIELRIAAMLSEDTYMTEVFTNGGDIHAAVASRVFETDADKIDYEQRRRAKIINFGMLYGMGVNALQKQLGTDRKEAQIFYNAYFEGFPAITKYLEDTKEFARNNGYTETMFGRKRFFSNIKSKLPFIRAMAERMAINAPIQGTEADLIKLAMNQIDTWITQQNLDTEVKMVMQVHDEIVFEIQDEKIEEVVPQLIQIMESAFDQDWIKIEQTLPIKVDYGVGKNWFEVK